MDKHIAEYLSHLLPELAKLGITICSQREIPYGMQLRLERGSESATLNLYYSAKKGLSKVIGASGNSSLKQDLETLCGQREIPVQSFHTWERWIGSDECGKGDYFGALVVAAFAMDSEIERDVRALGVMDSKRLRDPQIQDIARKLYERYNSRIACIVIKPLKYNEIIADMKSRGKNLNDLLAWQHGTVISDLLQRFPLNQGVLVDQFSLHKKVWQYFKSRDLPVHVEERPKAEADTAVAAASIVARYQFLQSRQAMDRHYSITFPLGCNKSVLKPAQMFVDKYGLKRLAEVAKLHFVTSRKVQQKEIGDE